jgi:hypothetical protein
MSPRDSVDQAAAADRRLATAIAAARPALLAPIVLAEGPYPTSWTRESATAVVPSSWMPPFGLRRPSGAR